MIMLDSRTKDLQGSDHTVIRTMIRIKLMLKIYPKVFLLSQVKKFNVLAYFKFQTDTKARKDFNNNNSFGTESQSQIHLICRYVME